MKACKYCKVEKPDSEMAVWAGKPSLVCIECKKAHPNGGSVSRGNGNGGGGVDHRKKSPAAVSRRKPKAAAAIEIEVPGGGHGFKAALTDEDTLLITQVNDGADDDNIVLTRHEAKQLFDRFGEWIVES